MIIVPAAGPQPCEVLICGEAPGKTEAEKGRPFAGKSGDEQEAYLARHGLSARRWRMTNIVSEYRDGNPDPSAEQIEYWTPHLLDEITKTSPKLLVAVGRFAMRWFLGESAELDSCHGLPHRAGAFDSSRAYRAPEGCTVLPVIHPAAGMRGDGAKRPFIAADYARVAEVLKRIQRGLPIDYRIDEYEGRECYVDMSGSEMAALLDTERFEVVGFDTEGMPDSPWCVQVSTEPGSAYVLRVDRDDFAEGRDAIQHMIDSGTVLVGSNIVMHDFAVCRAMGLNVARARVFDTMYAAYLTRLEPQGLKALAWRWCGMKMLSHEETVGALGIQMQLDYLADVLAREWPAPEQYVEMSNDGTAKLKKPWSIERRAENIIKDVASGKLDKDGNPTDPLKRWRKVDKALRRAVEVELGEMPIGSMRRLAELDFDAAIRYSARDSDAGIRLYPKLTEELARQDLTQLMADGMQTIPAFEEMKRVGIPASRVALQQLADEMTDKMYRLQSFISTTYYSGKPFNPGSDDQFATLVRRRGLRGEKRTPTGKMSVAKKSIEHLRSTDDAVAKVFEWRECQHTRDSFCEPFLEIIPEDVDVYSVQCDLTITRTTTRRLASKAPNLLAMPKHSKYGKRVRDCFVCADSYVFAEYDLSQVEARILAHESADPIMCRLFDDRRDIHKETASRIFGIPLDSVTDLQRFYAKRIGYGIPYGTSGQGLADQIRVMTGSLEWDGRTCDKFIGEYLKLYKGVARYITAVENEVASRDTRIQRRFSREPEVVIDSWRMPRYLPAIGSHDRKLAAEARRQAVNHRIQGCAQGMIQHSIKYLYPIVLEMQEAGLDIHWCMEYHDSLLFIMLEELYDAVTPIVKDALINRCGMTLRVPLDADAKMSRTWGGLGG